MAFQIDINTTEAFKQEVLSTPGVLQIVECYNDWAGPCKAIASTLKSLCFSFNDMPLKFYTINVDKVQGFESYQGKCQPVFLLYKDGAVRQTVAGVQGPSLVQLITSMLTSTKAGDI